MSNPPAYAGASGRRARARVRPHVLAACLSALLPVIAGCASQPAPSPGAPQSRDAQAQAVVVAAHPMAVDAGMAVLRRGGSAMDAAVAVQLMLGLVEPQSSGIGGGAIVMAYDAKSRAKDLPAR